MKGEQNRKGRARNVTDDPDARLSTFVVVCQRRAAEASARGQHGTAARWIAAAIAFEFGTLHDDEKSGCDGGLCRTHPETATCAWGSGCPRPAKVAPCRRVTHCPHQLPPTFTLSFELCLSSRARESTERCL